jgi:hypothetical protein
MSHRQCQSWRHLLQNHIKILRHPLFHPTDQCNRKPSCPIIHKSHNHTQNISNGYMTRRFEYNAISMFPQCLTHNTQLSGSFVSLEKVMTKQNPPHLLSNANEKNNFGLNPSKTRFVWQHNMLKIYELLIPAPHTWYTEFHLISLSYSNYLLSVFCYA